MGFFLVVAALVVVWMAVRSRFPESAPYLGIGGIAWIVSLTVAFSFWQEDYFGYAVKLWSWSQVDLLHKAGVFLLGKPSGLSWFPWAIVGFATWLSLYLIVGFALFWTVEKALSVTVGRTVWHRACVAWSIALGAYWLVAAALWRTGIVDMIE